MKKSGEMSNGAEQTRLTLLGGASLLFFLLFWPLYQVTGRSVVALAVIPIIAAGMAFDLSGGLIAGFLSIPINALLLAIVEPAGSTSFTGINFWFSHAVFILMGLVVGYMSSIRKRLENELVERRRVETERDVALDTLKEYSDQLQKTVKEQTVKLHHTQEQLLRQEKLAVLGQMAGSVGHELRGPLGNIANAAYLLETSLENADETIQDCIAIISKDVFVSEKIIADLLGFARTRPAEKVHTPLKMLVDQVLEQHQPPQGIAINAQLPTDLPAVFIDPEQVKLVLGNLITNAYQAMPQGGQLTISACAAKDHVAVSVTDTGGGIPQENLGKLFEPLFTTKSKGIGLGLTLTKALVENNGGTIQVESVPGQGSIFTTTFPQNCT